MENLFFDSWESVLRITIITILGYISLVIMLRITGKRTLSKMNAFDFVVTIALGSAFATVAINKSVPLLDGLLVLFLLIILQYIITWISVRVKQFKKIITGEPRLLLYRGSLLEENLRKERITIEEIYLAARGKGISKLKEIDAVILETNGEITIIKNMAPSEVETMNDVKK